MRRSERGTTFLEVIAVATIIAILAAAVLPLSRITRQRQREIELRRCLREMRTAVDRFKDWEHSAHITLRRGERSRLADYASEVL